MKTPLRISDHALVRFLSRAGGLNVEGVREHLAMSLQRSYDAASKIGLADFTIKVDGLEWHIKNSVAVTVTPIGFDKAEHPRQPVEA